ncbi:hypothetical protein CCS38_23805 [Streptomyces purpurogeneiscleroticus]|nr:hypothetical protein [Streptomyces purpurogeneiscleroticus]
MKQLHGRGDKGQMPGASCQPDALAWPPVCTSSYDSSSRSRLTMTQRSVGSVTVAASRSPPTDRGPAHLCVLHRNHGTPVSGKMSVFGLLGGESGLLPQRLGASPVNTRITAASHFPAG